MDVYQCPECELRFRFASELRSHIADDHPEFHAEQSSVSDDLLAESHRHRRRKTGVDQGPTHTS